MAPKKRGRKSKSQSESSAPVAPLPTSGPFSNPDKFLKSIPETKTRVSIGAGPDSLYEDVKLTMQRLSEPSVWKDYKTKLQSSIKSLRDWKLRLYAQFTQEAKRDVTLSQSKIEVWRRVFEERYGLSADPDSSAATFIEKAVEKMVPEDMENITRYIRFRQIFLMLYRDANARRSAAARDPVVLQLVQPSAESKAGGRSTIKSSRRKEEEGLSRVGGAGGASVLGHRVGGKGKRKGKDGDDSADSWEQRYDALNTAYVARFHEKARESGCENVNPKQDIKDPEKLMRVVQCLTSREAAYVRELNNALEDVTNSEEQLIKIKNRREALQGAQPWMTDEWSNLEELPSAEDAVDELYAQIVRMVTELVGRDEILNRMASIIHTFAYNPYAFLGTYLNYALLGMPGTGKTTIAREIGKLLRSLGILVTKKFSTVGREDMVGQYLGETALKTKALLTNHIEGVLFLDEAYSLGTRDSSGKPDVYGVESLNTLTNFTDKWRGQFSFIAAGYEKDMNEDFFDVNPGLERRFLRLKLPPFSAVQLVKMFLSKLNDKIRSPREQEVIANPKVWSFIRSAFEALNRCCRGEKVPKCYFPNQGGDIENLSDETVQYVYNNVFVRQPEEFTVCDMQTILQRFLLRLKRESIIVSNPEYDSTCPENKRACVGNSCVRIGLTPSPAGCNGDTETMRPPPPPLLRLKTLPLSPRAALRVSAPASPINRTRPSRRRGGATALFQPQPTRLQPTLLQPTLLQPTAFPPRRYLPYL